MVPVAVSVPYGEEVEVEMETDNWAFGKVKGKPEARF